MTYNELQSHATLDFCLVKIEDCWSLHLGASHDRSWTVLFTEFTPFGQVSINSCPVSKESSAVPLYGFIIIGSPLKRRNLERWRLGRTQESFETFVRREYSRWAISSVLFPASLASLGPDPINQRVKVVSHGGWPRNVSEKSEPDRWNAAKADSEHTTVQE